MGSRHTVLLAVELELRVKMLRIFFVKAVQKKNYKYSNCPNEHFYANCIKRFETKNAEVLKNKEIKLQQQY